MIYAFSNKNWAKLLSAFNIKNLSSLQEILNLKRAILLISDDRLDEISSLKEKIEANDVVITELPADEKSDFDKNEIKSLIKRALGISTPS